MRLTAEFALSLTLLCACTPTAAPRGAHIEEARHLHIGGIEQWITIRGDDDRQPLLLLLHGGPGDVQSPFVATYAPYERDFVLVQWDQRGAGRTFAKLGTATPTLTLDRQIADGIELAQYLAKRFPDNKLILLGHSWGTIVAAGMVQMEPELFDAYIGSGQVASWAAVVDYQFDFLLAAARKERDAPTISHLEAIGRPDPTDLRGYFAVIGTLRAHTPKTDQAWLDGIPARLESTPGLTKADIESGSAGMDFSGSQLIGTLTHVDLTTTARTFAIPYCIIQGREDLNAPTPAVQTYFAAIEAPQKKLTVIENAGHFALATHVPEFIAALNQCPGVQTTLGARQ